MSTMTKKAARAGTALVLGSGVAIGGTTAFGSGAAHATTKDPAKCHSYGSSTTAADKVVKAACKEVAKHTKYSWAGGHHKKPGPSTGTWYTETYPHFNDTHKVGLDCSGLVRWAIYQGTGKDIGPGATGSMPRELKRHGWHKVAKATQPGDVVVYSGHTVIYLGAGKVVQAEGDIEGLNVSTLKKTNSANAGQTLGVFRYGGKAGTPTPPPSKPKPPTKGHSKVYKNVWAQAPSYTKASGGHKVGVLHKGRNYFFCQSKGTKINYAGYHNNWWLKTDDDSGNRNVWVNATHVSGGHNDGKIPGVPAC